MTIVLSVAVTLGCVVLLAATFQAGVRRGALEAVNEIRQAVRVARLEGTMTASGPVN